ncbi:unnamed protein product [Cylindrotheca closterium]|uniref:Transmembrane protein 43 homolog n=1 Tax=Cylindrotheca closterium TaxID=2856 RepID=A0AAD2G523_9STRA|nr:unnamed protein product [Cylindrotheca closterium]
MADSITRVTHQSFGSRMGGSCKGLIMAPIMILLSIWLLVWNEGNSITQHKALEEGLKMVINVGTDTIDALNENKLVHFIGKATSTNTISDEVFGVAPPDGALKLKRKVEMYQWTQSEHSQTKKNTGGSTTTTTTYTYNKEWSDHLISSTGFEEANGHQNPSEMVFESATMVADPIIVGAFTMSSVVTSKMEWYQPLTSSLSTETIADDYAKQDAKVYNSYFYFGNSPTSPSVGDTRISFKEVPEQVMSVVAKQTQSTVSTYTASSGGSFLLVEKGTVSAEDMFLHANQAVTAFTWLIRLFGMILIWCALKMVVQPLQVMADCIPFIGDILGAANDCVTFFLAFALSTIVIAISWFAYRPLLSLGLLLLVVAGGYFAKKRAKHNQQEIPYDAAAVEIPQVGQFKDRFPGDFA